MKKLLNKGLAWLLCGGMLFSMNNVALTEKVNAASMTHGAAVTLKALDVVEGQKAINDDVREMPDNYVEDSSVELVEGKLPENLDKLAPEMEGWTFKGWYTAPVKYAFWGDTTKTNISAYESVPDGYDTDCDGNDRDLIVKKESEDENTVSPALNKYWIWLSKLEKNKEGKKVNPGDELPEGVSELYALYEPTPIRYTLDYNGWGGTNGVMDCGRQYGTPFGNNDLKNWDGFVFDGWFAEDSDEQMGFYDIPKNNVRYEAHWHHKDRQVDWENYQEKGYSEVTKVTMKDGNSGNGKKDLGDTLQLHSGSANFKTIYAEVSPAGNGVTKLTWEVTGDTKAVRVECLDSEDGEEAVKGLRVNVYATDHPGKATIIVRSSNGKEDSVEVDTTCHAFDKSEVVKRGNCLNPTHILYTCVYCGKTEIREVFDRHVYAYRDVPATCTEPHKWVKYCKVCGTLEPDGDIIRGQALGHDFDISESTNGGVTTTTRTCKTCGYSESSSVESSEISDMTESSTPDTEKSDASETEKSEIDETEESQVPETEEPQVPETEEPKVSETEESEVAETEAPKVSETEAPEIAETEVSEVPETEAPEVSETEESEVPETEAPEVSETERSEVAEAEEPTVSDAMKPEVAETEEAKVPEIQQQEVPDAAQPEIAGTKESAVSETEEPAVPETEEPAVSDEEKPEVPETEKPAVSETEQQTSPDAVQSVVSTKDQPAVFVAGKQPTFFAEEAALSSVKKSGSKKAKVKFKKVSGAVGYEIVYSTNKNFRNSKKVMTKGTSVTLKKLKKNKKYYVKVRAYKTDSTGKNVYGKYSSVEIVKIK